MLGINKLKYKNIFMYNTLRLRFDEFNIARTCDFYCFLISAFVFLLLPFHMNHLVVLSHLCYILDIHSILLADHD
jgi:hypothetical protein